MNPLVLPRRAAALSLALLAVCSSCTNRPNTQVNGPLVSAVQISAMAGRGSLIARVRSPVTSTRVGLAMLIERAQELVRGNIPFSIDPAPRTSGVPGSAEF
ncbi:MAG: hypothetical protein VX633_09940, partial [Verrucomicrobiota bacterium]|nr:hypothetical protein [Verrucomicrobiota bacterium]